MAEPAAAVNNIPEDGTTQKSLISEIWEFKLFKIGNDEVQFNQIVIALIVVVIGSWISRRISRVTSRRLARLPHVKETSAVLVSKLVFYTLLVLVALVALKTVNIPVTDFAVIGGAFAIGLGFGAQNLFNNFISGLILIIERPIRVGDLVEVAEHIGRVEDVGARCTRIKRNDGVDLLVPNSVLLENNVINWTLSDEEIRTSIVTGVVYGSPTDVVAEILEESVREHPRVLNDKPIHIIFDEFGDNALIFESYFWTQVRTVMELRVIRSEVRYRIDARCRERGIVIAFPQRDVHLDTIRPLHVELVNRAESRAVESSP